ncbi:hypothetical protein LTR53_003102 [Teratosphaeriaceae sp. CCFEE 6253]|nr:hypothetical protein LTR53_003102 [Teratosphaeriaceae sp. CCFEE 6253]
MAVLTWPPPANGSNIPDTAPTTLTPTQVLDPTNPIDPSRFATALEALPLDALHSKAAEIRNSIAHLRHSNEQMMPFADDGDADCREAMFENLQVVGRMNTRLGLLKAEVEGRGMMWVRHEDDLRDKVEGNGEGSDANGSSGSHGVNGVNGHATQATSGGADSRGRGRWGASLIEQPTIRTVKSITWRQRGV